MNESKKVKLLSRLRDLLDMTNMPTVRDAGLTEDDAADLANDGLIALLIVRDKGEFIDRHRIEKITGKGFGALSRAGRGGTLLRTALEPEVQGRWKNISKALGLGAWDLLKVFLGGVIGWYLKKHFP